MKNQKKGEIEEATIVCLLLPILSSLILASQPPGNPQKCCPSIVDEDTYVAAIEKIIECNFFPDIPRLHDHLDWLKVVRSGDPILIHDAQLKILERRAIVGAGKTPSTAPDITATGNHSRTPGSTFFPAPSTTPFGSDHTLAVHLLPLGFSVHDRSSHDVVAQSSWPHHHRIPSPLPLSHHETKESPWVSMGKQRKEK